jgi:hypothetical protein
VPQPTTLPRAPDVDMVTLIIIHSRFQMMEKQEVKVEKLESFFD